MKNLKKSGNFFIAKFRISLFDQSRQRGRLQQSELARGAVEVALGRGYDLLLCAQLVLATAIGIVVLRSQPRLEPLASATGEKLKAPLGSLINALLVATQDQL